MSTLVPPDVGTVQALGKNGDATGVAVDWFCTMAYRLPVTLCHQKAWDFIVLELELAGVTLAGNFNPYLISPEWLKTQGIWSADNVQLALGAMKRDGVKFRNETAEWHVSSERLVINSTTLDCGTMASKVLESLPHTPMSAVGSNFVYQDISPENAYPVFDAITAVTEAVPDKLEPILMRWGLVLHEDDVRTEIVFVNGEQGTTVSFNHHRATASASAAGIAAQKFECDKKRSQLLLDAFPIRQV